MKRLRTYHTMYGRYFEVDAARGVALILMIIYHILFCLYFLTDLIPWFNPVTYSGAPIAFLFISIAGLSLILSVGRETDIRKSAKKLFFRGLYILVFAGVVTLVTWIFYPQGFVVFGVLHLIGCGTILAIPFTVLKLRWYVPAVFGLICLLLNPIVSVLRGPAFLVPFGITYLGFYTVDYEPLIPWFGIMLLGIAAGLILYPSGVRGRLLSKLGGMPAVLRPLCFIGRHTLIVYLIHVPIIIGTLFIFGLVSL